MIKMRTARHARIDRRQFPDPDPWGLPTEQSKSLAAEKPYCSLVELTTINANSFAASHLFLVVSGGISTGRSGYHGCERGA
jgi:hypothetical protein